MSAILKLMRARPEDGMPLYRENVGEKRDWGEFQSAVSSQVSQMTRLADLVQVTMAFRS